jgi:hypothetical protein
LRPASDRKVHWAPTESRNSLVLRMLSVVPVDLADEASDLEVAPG